MLTAIGSENIVWRGQTISIASYEQLKLAKDGMFRISSRC